MNNYTSNINKYLSKIYLCIISPCKTINKEYYGNSTLPKNKHNPEFKIAFKNGGCCGAVSDAWLPSYPSK